MISKDAINILKGIQQENLEEKDFLGKCAIDMAIEALIENESLAKSVNKASELLRKKRPHGTWKPDGTCSECSVYSSLNKDTAYFCPNCGADMRIKKEGESEWIIKKP